MVMIPSEGSAGRARPIIHSLPLRCGGPDPLAVLMVTLFLVGSFGFLAHVPSGAALAPTARASPVQLVSGNPATAATALQAAAVPLASGASPSSSPLGSCHGGEGNRSLSCLGGPYLPRPGGKHQQSDWLTRMGTSGHHAIPGRSGLVGHDLRCGRWVSPPLRRVGRARLWSHRDERYVDLFERQLDRAPSPDRTTSRIGGRDGLRSGGWVRGVVRGLDGLWGGPSRGNDLDLPRRELDDPHPGARSPRARKPCDDLRCR